MTEWEETTLGKIVTFGNGKVRPQSEGKIPVYGGNGILGSCNKSNYESNTIIIGRVGAYCGSVYYSDRPIWVSDNALAALPKGDGSVKYFYYFLKNLNLNNYAEGSSHPLVTQTLLNAIEVVVTNNIQVQESIAELLSCLDDKIDLLHRNNKTLEQFAETLFRQWFVEEADDIWEEVSLSSIIDVRDGTHDSPKQKEVGRYLITSKHLKSNGIDYASAYKISDVDYTKINKRSKVEINDILFSMIGTLGLIHYVDTEPDYAIKNMGVFKTSKHPEFAFYLYLLLNSTLGKKFIYENADGSTQEYITLSSLRSFPIKYPGRNRINDFNDVITPYFLKLFANKKQIQQLESIRDTLLPKLMSGEVRLFI